MRQKYIKLTPNQPQTLTFADVPPSVVSGQYGPRREYVVNGSQVLTASDYLADQIDAALDGLDQGAPRVLTLEMYKNKQNRTRYNVTTLDEGDEEVPWEQSRGAPAKPRARVDAPMERTFGSVLSAYASCLVHAKMICAAEFEEEGFNNEDVRSIATTLFIEANRSGLEIPNPYTDATVVTDEDDE